MLVATAAIAGSGWLAAATASEQSPARRGGFVLPTAPGPQSVARQWNDLLLESIRNDYARPTIHARNLYHVSVAMYDGWAVYEPNADGVLYHEKINDAKNTVAAQEETLSFAAYRIMKARFASSPGANEVLPTYDALMDALGYDKDYKGTLGSDPAAVGNRIAVTVLAHGFADGANEQNDYENQYYEPINPPLLPDFTGNPDIIDQNRWQPLALEWFEDQGGNIIVGGYPEALSPEWGIVTPFSLKAEDATIHQRDGFDYWVYHDPGPPPYHNGEGDEYYRWGFEMVSIWSSHLDHTDGVMWDISPGTIGNADVLDPSNYALFYNRLDGGDNGTGYVVNPVTGLPYNPQIVPRGDYTRVLAEYWADGPDSETPPGHWFTIANYVQDHVMHVNQIGGDGEVLSDLEYDVKMYLAMGGTMHDVAIQCWGTKGWYDYIRPVSAIRYLCDQGQSSDSKELGYNPDGIRLEPGLIEVITPESSAPGQRHEHLAGFIGGIAVYAWRGPDYIVDPETDVAGVGWILAGDWWPYQRPSFVTPPFPGYTSGHSTYSRAAAWIMEFLTGSAYFPGGLGEFYCPQNEFLVFEEGPSVNLTLQWARYQDASDQTSLSRIWGGIHPPADDLPGRLAGDIIAADAWCEATRYFNGQFSCPSDIDGDGAVTTADLLAMLTDWNSAACNADLDRDGNVGTSDLLQMLSEWGECP